MEFGSQIRHGLLNSDDILNGHLRVSVHELLIIQLAKLLALLKDMTEDQNNCFTQNW